MHDCLLLKSARRWWGGARTIKGPQIEGVFYVCVMERSINMHAWKQRQPGHSAAATAYTIRTAANF